MCLRDIENIVGFKEKCLRSEAIRNEQIKIVQELEVLKGHLNNAVEIEFMLPVEEKTTATNCINESNVKSEGASFSLGPIKSKETNEKFTVHIKEEPPEIVGASKAVKSKTRNQRNRLCVHCGKTFKTSEIHRHIKIHLNQRESVCDVCGKGYNSDTTLRLHKICVHDDPQTWKHVCNYCGKRFPFKGGLQLHLRRHKGEKRFFCEICGKGFCDKVMLQTHCVSHSNERSFECKECGNYYKYLASLQNHQRKAHKMVKKALSRTFLCHLCSKQFVSSISLEKHVDKHGEENKTLPD